MKMRTSVVVCLIVLTAGCSNTATPPPTAPVAATVTAIAMTGLPSSLAVGAKAQLIARATYSDGRVDDVTNRARWSTRNVLCLVNATGLLEAMAEGDCDVEVSFENARAASTIRVAAPSVFTISGVVREKWGLGEPPIPFATVTLMTGAQAGRSVRADANGRYELKEVPKAPVQLRAVADGFDSNTDDVTPERAVADFRLEPPIEITQGTLPVRLLDGTHRTVIRVTVRHRAPVVMRVASNFQQCEISYSTVFGATLHGSQGYIADVCPNWTAGYGSPAVGEYRGFLDPGEYTIEVWYSWLSGGWTREFYISRPR